jgi:hypothetical protein
MVQVLHYNYSAVFATYLTYEYLDEVYEEQIDTPYNDVIYGAVTFPADKFGVLVWLISITSLVVPYLVI